MGMNPALAAEADLVYIDWLDQNFYCMLNGEDGTQVKPYPKKRIAVRMIDIDYYQGRHRAPVIWSYLDDMILINKFYYDLTHVETTPHSDGKLHLIRPGVDLKIFTFKPDRERGYNIGIVTGNLWEAKDGFGAIRIFQEVVHKYPNQPWELYIRGQYIDPAWHTYAYNQLIESTGLADRIHIIPNISQPEMVAFYQRMDYILVTSHKEAFSYATAEGMATGAKPILNNWFGSEWDDKYRFSSIHEAVEMIGEGDYNPEEYRQYIQDNYDAERMFRQYDELFQT